MKPEAGVSTGTMAPHPAHFKSSVWVTRKIKNKELPDDYGGQCFLVEVCSQGWCDVTGHPYLTPDSSSPNVLYCFAQGGPPL